MSDSPKHPRTLHSTDGPVQHRAATRRRVPIRVHIYLDLVVPPRAVHAVVPVHEHALQPVLDDLRGAVEARARVGEIAGGREVDAQAVLVQVRVLSVHTKIRNPARRRERKDNGSGEQLHAHDTQELQNYKT